MPGFPAGQHKGGNTMAFFDLIISEGTKRFGLDSERTGGLVAALLGFISDPAAGGFSGFLDRFRSAGLGGIVDSWIGNGANEELNAHQLEAGLGPENLTRIAADAGVERDTAAAAMAGMLPGVVDQLSPDGALDETNIGARIGEALGFGTAASGLSGSDAAAARSIDRLDASVGTPVEPIHDRHGQVVDQTDATIGSTIDTLETGPTRGDNSDVMKWLLPLIILALLVALLFWFCGRGNTAVTDVNANVNRGANSNTNRGNVNLSGEAVESSFSIRATGGKYTVSGVVPDQAAYDDIRSKLTAQFGEANVDITGLRVDPNAAPFAGGWSANFGQMLPDLKEWRDGTLEFRGVAVRSASGLSPVAAERLRTLFKDWTLPGAIDPENAARRANEEAAKALGSASSIEEVIDALNVSIINFASGSSAIPSDAGDVLDKAAEVLKKQAAGSRIEIGGHTDNDGNDDANMKLSQARADAVKKALEDRGVNSEMLVAKGYGETQPLDGNTNSTDDEKYANRRIEYKTATGQIPAAANTTRMNTNTAANTNANSNSNMER